MEVEKGVKSKSEIAKMFGVPKIHCQAGRKEGYLKFGLKRRNMRHGQYS